MNERSPSCAMGAASMHPLRVRLGEVCKEVSIRNKDGRIKAVFSVTNSKGFVPSTDYFNKEVFSKNLATYKIVECGMFAYNPSRINVGSIGCYNDTDPVVVSPLYVVFSVDETQVDHSYLLSFLKGDFALAQVKNLTSGSVRDSLKFSAFCQILIHLPSLAKQRQIAARIDNISKIVTKRKAQLGQLQQLVKSRFVEMFGDPMTNPLEWTMARLGDKCTITTGNTPPRADAKNYGDFIEWIKSDNIVDGQLTRAVERLSEEGFEKSRYAGPGAILMTCIAGSLNSIGNCAMVDRQVAFNQQLNAITPGEEYDGVFLLWLLRLSKRGLHKGINKCLKGILSKGNLSGKELPLPPLTLQREFAAFVAKVDKLAFAVRKSLETAEKLYRQQLSEAFA